LICQIGEDAEVYRVLGKSLGVLGHAELCEPIRNLLHRGPFPRADIEPSFWTG
jgi:hypothetical protein